MDGAATPFWARVVFFTSFRVHYDVARPVKKEYLEFNHSKSPILARTGNTFTALLEPFKKHQSWVATFAKPASLEMGSHGRGMGEWIRRHLNSAPLGLARGLFGSRRSDTHRPVTPNFKRPPSKILDFFWHFLTIPSRNRKVQGLRWSEQECVLKLCWRPEGLLDPQSAGLNSAQCGMQSCQRAANSLYVSILFVSLPQVDKAHVQQHVAAQAMLGTPHQKSPTWPVQFQSITNVPPRKNQINMHQCLINAPVIPLWANTHEI